MAEYISREEALNLIEHNDRVCHYADERYENVVYATAQTICKVVAEMPAADVQPVKRGRWTYPYKDKDINQCSECRCCVQDKISNVREMFAYCPFCGARMKGD